MKYNHKKWLVISAILSALVLLFALTVYLQKDSRDPTITTQAWAGGGEQLVYGVPADMTPVPLKVTSTDGYGALDVYLQDQHTEIIDVYLVSDIATTTLASAPTINTNTIVLTAGHGALVTYTLTLEDQLTGTFQQVDITAINVNTITVDSPIEYAFPAATTVVYIGSKSMTVDGSSSSAVYSLRPPIFTGSSVAFDITRILIQLTDDAAMDDSKFGGISALTNGCVLRVKDSDDGTYDHIFNVKSNSDWIARAYDVTYSDKVPAGFYGFRVRRSFSGQSKNGVTIRLVDSTQYLEFIVQDDLTALSTFAVVAQGHFVVD